MRPYEIGRTYDAFAPIWDARHDRSVHGVACVQRALVHCRQRRRALDVGCGAGGRMVRLLVGEGFAVTGLDVSAEMIRRARRKHPQELFLLQDICTWHTAARFDFILAWDSLWHLPLTSQRPVLDKLCQLLQPDGVLLYTLIAHLCADHSKQERWTETFERPTHFSSLGVIANIEALSTNNVEPLHVAPDRYPVYIVARAPRALNARFKVPPGARI